MKQCICEFNKHITSPTTPTLQCECTSLLQASFEIHSDSVGCYNSIVHLQAKYKRGSFKDKRIKGKQELKEKCKRKQEMVMENNRKIVLS